MKRIITVILCLLPLGLNAQILGPKHHLEAGIGLAVPGELLFKTDFKDSPAADFYAQYRFDITPSIAVGAIYSFVLPHKGEKVSESPSYGNISGRTLSTHDINAFAEFKYNTPGALDFFVGVGGGANISHLKFSESLYYSNYLRPELSVHAGVEIYNHLRITVRHNHDIYIPSSESDIFPGFPYYSVNVGWSF